MRATPSTDHRRDRLLIAGAFATLLAVVLVAALASAAPAPPPLIEFGETGSAAGQTVIPRGMAVDPANGHLFVADSGNSRIQEFSPWGGIVRAWGWGVVASGPANDPKNEIQRVTVDATGGEFRLRFFAINRGSGSSTTAPIPFDASAAAVQAAFEAIDPVFGDAGFEPGDVSVSGPAGGPWAIEFTGVHADADHQTLEVASSTLSGGAASASVATLQKGANFEVCVPADGDVCRQGQPGPAPGQVAFPLGVALDSDGDLYVVEPPCCPGNRRVQKFDVSGPGVQFAWVAGGGVNQGPSNPGNLCTAAHVTGGDSCGAGTEGAAPGQFGALDVPGSYIAVDTRGTAATGDDRVYVGDQGRIQRFDAGGGYVSELAVPGETVQSLAVDGAGDLYVALRESPSGSKDDVRKLSAAGASLGTIAVGNPRALATDAAGNLYVFAQPFLEDESIRVFDPDGEPVASFSDGFSDSTGIASSSACGLESASVYVGNAHFQNSFIRLYGPPFDVDVCPPPSVAPDIADQHAVEVGTGSATLRARINPRFWADTSYRVEFGKVDCAVGPCQELPATQLGAGIVSAFRLTAPVALGGLEPGTVYHYRFVAESSGGGPAFGPDRSFRTFPAALAEKTDCPNQAFRTGASARLPDCRAFELVSPVDKGGTPIDSRGDGLEQAAGDGEALTFSSIRAFADPASAPNVSQYLARRDAARGWSSSSISPPRQGAPFPLFDLEDLFSHYKAFSADLCSGWVLHPTEPKLTADALEGFPNLYRRRSCGAASGTYEAATTVAPTEIDAAESGGAFRPVVQGFSADGSRAVFRAIGRLQPNLAACSQAIHPEHCVRRLYLAEQGQLTLVSRLPNGNPATTQSSVGSPDEIETKHRFGSISRAVSADGTRIYWTTGTTAGNVSLRGKLYLRLNATEPQSAVAGGECTQPALACTVEVSADDSTLFHTAASDGSQALYTSGQVGDADLYRFDVSTKQSTLIAGGVIGVAGASDDLSRFYFASRQALAAGASAGEPNLYLHEGGEHRFVAALSARDAADANSPAVTAFSPLSFTSARRTSRVSPDGRSLAFTTAAPIADYDNVDTASGQRAGEVYVYDAVTDEPRCVSCNPSGARPAVESLDSLSTPLWTAARVPPWNYNLHPGRPLSDDGSRLFFESFDALLPRDTNGRKDVYEWSRAGGEQECRDRGAELYVESAGGCLSLISTGTSGEDSSFVDASADGGDVFIRTASGLVAHDRDGFVDIYDARVGGGFAAPADPPPPCEGDACQPAPTAAPPAPTAATITFSGPPSPDLGPRGRPGRVRVTKPKPVRGFAARLRVKLPAAGRVTVSGRLIRKAARKRSEAGTVRVPVRLTAKAKRALKRKRTLKAKVRVVFKPTTGPRSRARVSLTFERPKSRKGARGRAATAGEGGAK